MKSKNVSDVVASTMDDILKSQEMQSLFRTKVASTEEECKEDECDVNDSSDNVLDVSLVDDKDETCADDEQEKTSAEQIAVDSLVTASMSLDALGFNKSAELTLKIANLVVEAAKKKKDPKAEKAKEKAAKEKAKKEEKEKADKNEARMKAKEKAKKEEEKEKAAKEKEKAAKDKKKGK